jgi:flagellar assembly protein FliH
LSNRIIPKERAATLRKVDLSGLSAGRIASPAPPAPSEREVDAVRDRAEFFHARELARREGMEEGRREAAALLEGDRLALKALIAGMNEVMQDFEQSLANDVLSMSLELAKLIVRQALRVKPEAVVAVVREAVESLPGVSDQTVLLVHPADAVLIRMAAENDRALSELPWKIVEDEHMERGGCRLETPTTEVDATLETRWRRVLAALGRDDPWIDITI